MLLYLGKASGLDVDLNKFSVNKGKLEDWYRINKDGGTEHASETDLVANLEKHAMLSALSRSPRYINMLVSRYRMDICLFGYNRTRCPNNTKMDQLASRLRILA